MAVLIEQYVPVVRENGIQTNKVARFNAGIQSVRALVSGQGATSTLTSAQSGSLVLFDRAAGIIFTLPTPVIGAQFDLLVPVSVTSNSYKIITSAANVFLTGSITNIKTDLTQLQSIGDGTTMVSIVLNGSTTGGLVGSYFRLVCVSANLWLVEGNNIASGIIASPFATS